MDKIDAIHRIAFDMSGSYKIHEYHNNRYLFIEEIRDVCAYIRKEQFKEMWEYSENNYEFYKTVLLYIENKTPHLFKSVIKKLKINYERYIEEDDIFKNLIK